MKNRNILIILILCIIGIIFFAINSNLNNNDDSTAVDDSSLVNVDNNDLEDNVNNEIVNSDVIDTSDDLNSEVDVTVEDGSGEPEPVNISGIGLSYFPNQDTLDIFNVGTDNGSALLYKPYTELKKELNCDNEKYRLGELTLANYNPEVAKLEFTNNDGSVVYYQDLISEEDNCGSEALLNEYLKFKRDILPQIFIDSL